jgi:hypothetical protein
MAWPWQFVALSNEQILLRREVLDRYGVYAQLSALIPLVAFQLYRLATWVSFERERAKPDYEGVYNGSSSPSRKQKRSTSTLISRERLRDQWDRTKWWLGGEVYPGWGGRGHCAAGLLWASWLLFLCVHNTGNGMCVPFLRYCSLCHATNTVAVSPKSSSQDDVNIEKVISCHYR